MSKNVLQWSLQVLKNRYVGRAFETPWSLVKLEVCLAKCRASSQFLTRCRRTNVIPKFIQNCSKASSLFTGVRGIRSCEERFHRIVLSRVIEEKFQKINSLVRERQRLLRDVREDYGENEGRWIIGHSQLMSATVYKENVSKLRKKYDALVKAEDGKMETQVPADTDRLFSPEKRVHIDETVKDSIPQAAKSILEKGPKFVPCPSVTKKVIREVEVSVERFAFGQRWSQKIEDDKAALERVREEEKKRKQKSESEQCSTTCDNSGGPGGVSKKAEAEDVGTAEQGENPDGGDDITVEGDQVPLLAMDVRLRKLCPATKQPPPMEWAKEKKLRRLKEDIVELYEKQASGVSVRSCQLKMSKNNRNVVESLASDTGVVIKPSDKSKGFVVMSSEQYVEKVTTLLSSTSEYESVSVKTSVLDERVREFVAENVKGKVPQKLGEACSPHYSRMSQFYGLRRITKLVCLFVPSLVHVAVRLVTCLYSWRECCTSCYRSSQRICQVHRSSSTSYGSIVKFLLGVWWHP